MCVLTRAACLSPLHPRSRAGRRGPSAKRRARAPRRAKPRRSGACVTGALSCSPMRLTHPRARPQRGGGARAAARGGEAAEEPEAQRNRGQGTPKSNCPLFQLFITLCCASCSSLTHAPPPAPPSHRSPHNSWRRFAPWRAPPRCPSRPARSTKTLTPTRTRPPWAQHSETTTTARTTPTSVRRDAWRAGVAKGR